MLSYVSSVVYSQILKRIHPQTGWASLVYNFFYFFRRILIKHSDPICIVKLYGRRLTMRLSHPLPLKKALNPKYDDVLVRLKIFFESQNLKPLIALDVGANIGDTIFSIYGKSDRFLAIEPDLEYFSFLKKNTENDNNITCLNIGCGETSSIENFKMSSYQGTAQIKENPNSRIEFNSVDDLIIKYPEFTDLNLLKIDTDGYDFKVLLGARNIINKNLPAIWFECGPFSTQTHYVDDYLEWMNFVEDCGYTFFLAYDSDGDLIGKTLLKEKQSFIQTLFYQMTGDCYYYDVLLMKETDLKLFHNSEVEFFLKNMKRTALRETATKAGKLIQG